MAFWGQRKGALNPPTNLMASAPGACVVGWRCREMGVAVSPLGLPLPWHESDGLNVCTLTISNYYILRSFFFPPLSLTLSPCLLLIVFFLGFCWNLSLHDFQLSLAKERFQARASLLPGNPLHEWPILAMLLQRLFVNKMLRNSSRRQELSAGNKPI